MKKNKLLLILPLTTIVFQTFSQKVDLKALLLEEVNLENTKNTTAVIFIITELDCSSCILKLNKVNYDDIPIYGLYYSKNDSKGFLKRLKKVNSKINWIPLKNKNILKALKKTSGPHQFTIHEDILSNDPYWAERL